MKKILLPILSLILAACSSSQVAVTRSAQVTVTSSPPPTATPIPTPTLHPQFVKLQDQVAASGERFTLNPDGTIQDGAITVPGLFVDKNGTITLQIGGVDSYMILSPESLSFDDTKGVNVNGYTLDEATGLWVTTELTPEEQLADDMKLLKLSGKPEIDEAGNMILKNEAGKIIYNNGWLSNEVEGLIANAGVCKQTNFMVDPDGKGTNSVMKDQYQEFTQYWWKMIHTLGATEAFKSVNSGPMQDEDGVLNYDILPMPVDGTDQCWIFFISPSNPSGKINYIMFELSDGSVIGMPVVEADH